jgi:hypothetical protein
MSSFEPHFVFKRWVKGRDFYYLFVSNFNTRREEREKGFEEEEDEGNTIFIHEPMKISTSPGNEC